MPVHIVTDSTTDLPGSVRAAAAIRVVPLRVHFGDEVFRDRVDLSDEAFVSRLAGALALPRTSQPPPGDFEAVYRELLRGPEDRVVSLHLAERLSGTCGSARTAAMAVDPDRIQVIDTRTVSLAAGFLVLEAAALAAQGRSAAEVVAAVGALLPGSGGVAAVDTLRYLERGGRISRVQAVVGSVLSVKPVVGLEQDGAVVQLCRVRSRGQARARLLELLAARGPLRRCGVIHVGAPDAAAGFQAEVAARYPRLEVLCQHLSPVLATHTGPGLLGCCWLVAPPAG